MKFKKERIIIFISTILSLILGYFVWDLIELEYKEVGIIGFYSINKFNANNDIIRYFIFVSLPILVFLILNFLFRKNASTHFLSFFKSSKTKFNFFDNKILNYLFILFFVIIILDFISIDFPQHLIDSFHEGQKLSSSFRFYLDSSLWSKSYVTVGIFYETLSAAIFWNIFDTISIGASRYGDLVYIYIFKTILLYFFYVLAQITCLENLKQNIFFITNSILSFHVIDYDLNSGDLISYRDLPALLLAILFIKLTYIKKSNFLLIIIAIVGFFSFLWSIDRGLVCNLLVLSILIYLLLEKRINEILVIIFATIFLWFLFYYFFTNEFLFFLDNTYLIFKEMSYVHGLIHPTPFSNEYNSSRATKTILLIIAILLISINLIFKKKYPNNFSKTIIFLSIISFGSYLYALGRSDGGHIKGCFGFPLITICSYLSFVFLKKKFFFKKEILLSLNLLFIIFFIANSKIKISNIYNYKDRVINYVNIQDEYFLKDKESYLLKEINKIPNIPECIQLFSNDAILYYLLRKKSCTKFYFVWSASSIFNQKRMILELKNTDFIIAGGDKNNWEFPLEKKLMLIDSFIKQNFILQKEIHNWKIYIKNKF
jgi:hypothetical protein